MHISSSIVYMYLFLCHYLTETFAVTQEALRTLAVSCSREEEKYNVLIHIGPRQILHVRTFKFKGCLDLECFWIKNSDGVLTLANGKEEELLLKVSQPTPLAREEIWDSLIHKSLDNR